jgi:hypothetical protein
LFLIIFITKTTVLVWGVGEDDVSHDYQLNKPNNSVGGIYLLLVIFLNVLL